jgi:uncharacterized protein YfbU (UPF0304 family)
MRESRATSASVKQPGICSIEADSSISSSCSTLLIDFHVMNLTKFERLTLANQFRILANLEPSSASDWKANAAILEQGYSGQYPSLFPGYSEELTPEECAEVEEILDMYRVLGDAYERLPDHGGLTCNQVTFGGFDGNHEIKQFAYAGFLVRDQAKWGELKNAELNSHSQRLPKYRAMLAVWKSLAESHDLSAEEALAIVARRTNQINS